jgi:hypothetical protein
MEKITIEMPFVSRCDANQCGYNVSGACHAKAITIGDFITPGCDTYFEASNHNKEAKRIAGVGACKVSVCRFNNDLECSASKIVVGVVENEINCLTFQKR